MSKVFIFLTKSHENKEIDFFDNVLRAIKKDDLQYKKDNDAFYFVAVQDDEQPNEDDKAFIEYINTYCNKIRKYLDKEKVEYNKKFLVAIHPPGKKKIFALLEWQIKINSLNHELNNYLFDIVYYSSNDKDNIFVINRKDYDYQYEILFGSLTEKFEVIKKEKFKKLLNLLEARVKGDEIEFFEIKKKLDDLYHIFSLKVLACQGILECIEKGKRDEAKKYGLLSFENKNFHQILAELKDKEEIKNLQNIETINPAMYGDIKKQLDSLDPGSYEKLEFDDQLKKYMEWYGEDKENRKNFFKTLLEKKEEVEKGD